MKPLTGMEIRNRWIKFFESKGHKNVPSVSLVPHGDKSLLWVNAGVTGLKKYFDGSEIPANRRMTNVQKCIRTNDIENVGHTARHHTFFEMLGNFSIGDYFRDEVIPWAFELLTDEEVGFGFPKEKLYITYNPMDKASLELWIKVGMIPDHMIPLEGNFWQIGEGPCGPDTEMFFDRGEKYDPEHRGVEMLKNDEENDRYIEIWNIVFSQFNAVNGVKREDYKELPSKNIDTGAGLERFACICQETPTNFETDLFMPIIEAVMKLSGKEYAEPNLMSFRVIADHIRCLTFALSDGAIFSNEGRGYVLRRIARRAMRYGQKLGINGPFLWNLVDIVVEKYAEWYPNLLEKKELVKKMILGEENKFSQTLMVGEKKLKKIVEEKGMISSEDAFLLYDTYGFPKDLTSEMGLELGAKVDLDNFD
ncbi:MAG: alanine--tRNA ligase, partial [Bacilli bacterium]|nr:alanine--tRNA ligase [Bacilli bacterium]